MPVLSFLHKSNHQTIRYVDIHEQHEEGKVNQIRLFATYEISLSLDARQNSK